MIGVLISVLVALGLGLGLQARLKGLFQALDPALALGASIALGLGLLGTAVFFFGLVPGGLRIAPWFSIAIGLVGWAMAFQSKMALQVKLPSGLGVLAPVAIALAGLFSLIGALAPPTMMEWDSLAYHLAVPKIWIAQGQAVPISFIHHSHFPFAVDNLYALGLQWGGEPGAKAFSLVFLLAGALAIFGLARSRFGSTAGWCASLAWVSVPTVLWESGTAYIDVAHGLFAGLGALVFLDGILNENGRSRLILGGLLLGLAAGSKYTGLQSIFAVVLVSAVLGLRMAQAKANFKSAGMALILAIGIASPWYIRNAVVTGNPVYPFFYEVLGGKTWGEFEAKIYRNEQQTFGVGQKESGGREFRQLGHAILGLSYQPGRYVNPGQSSGMGFPTGAMGGLLIAAGLALTILGRAKGLEGAAVGWVAVCLLMWFVLSQQSRYLTALAPPLALAVGALAAHKQLGRLLMVAIAAQTAYAFWLIGTVAVGPNLPVVLGQMNRQEFLRRNVGFAKMAEYINSEPQPMNVALYDELFGYLLDKSYRWAGPGHSNELSYGSINSAEILDQQLGTLGATHIYVNFAFQAPEFRERWFQVMGLVGPLIPWTPEEVAQLDADPQTKWKRLIGDAVAKGLWTEVHREGSGILWVRRAQTAP